MSTGLVIAIVVAAVIVLMALVVMGRRARAGRELKRERLGERVGGHRQEAEAHSSKAGELTAEREARRAEAAEEAREADHHAQLAEEHRQRAEEIEAESEEVGERVEREDRMSRRHVEQAGDLEEKL